jgi:hypothetical protein
VATNTAKNLKRLVVIADELERLDALYNERILIWHEEGVVEESISFSELARISRCDRTQVTKALRSKRLESALAGQRRRRTTQE